MANKKLLTSAIALGTAAALTLGGTFAWQSISQRALNEASDIVNPGGRLHDDFDGTNKDIYVENFADDAIFARVRLSEYFQVIMNYGVEGAQVTEDVVGSKDEAGNVIYEVYKFGEKANEDGTFRAAVDNGDAFWTWTVGGKTAYMPTFNVNKDSLEADINGIYEEGNVGTISNRDGTQYTEYTDWSRYEDAEGTTGVGAKKTGTEIYDADSNNIDEVGTDFENLETYINAKNIVTVDDAEHAVAETLDAQLISLTDWLTMVTDDGGYDKTRHGNYWVYDDEDGWVYWSAPIEGHTATGCLLTGIGLNQVMDDTWYYAIDVEAQFVTANDVGRDDATGFYADGEDPSYKAEKLLKAIGVELELTEKKLSIANPKVTVTGDWTYVTADVTVNGKAAADTAEQAVKAEITDGGTLLGTITDGMLTIETDGTVFHYVSNEGGVTFNPTLDLAISYTDADGDLLSAAATFKYAETMNLNDDGTGTITLNADDVDRVGVKLANGGKPTSVTVEFEGAALTENTDFTYNKWSGLLVITNSDYMGKTLTVTEYVDPTPASVSFYYNGSSAGWGTDFKVGVEDTLTLKFYNAENREITDEDAIKDIMDSATFTLSGAVYDLNYSDLEASNFVTKSVSGSDLKMTFDQDCINEITLTYQIGDAINGTFTLTPDFTDVYGDVELLRLGISVSTSSSATIARAEADAGEARYIYCGAVGEYAGYGTSWMTHDETALADGIFKSSRATVYYYEEDPGDALKQNGGTLVTISEDGTKGTLSDGSEVFTAEYTGKRCQKITFTKAGYVRVAVDAHTNNSIDRMGDFAVLVTVNE